MLGEVIFPLPDCPDSGSALLLENAMSPTIKAATTAPGPCHSVSSFRIGIRPCFYQSAGRRNVSPSSIPPEPDVQPSKRKSRRWLPRRPTQMSEVQSVAVADRPLGEGVT